MNKTGSRVRGSWRCAAAVTVGLVVSLLACVIVWQRVWCAAWEAEGLHAAACESARQWPLGLITLIFVIVFVQLTAATGTFMRTQVAAEERAVQRQPQPPDA